MPLVATLQGYDVSAPFMVVAAIYAAIYLALSVTGLHLLKGCDHSAELAQSGDSKGSSISVGQMFKAMFANKVAMLVLLTQLIKMFISSTIAASMVYYFTYNLQDLNAMSLQSSIAGFVGFLPVLFLPTLYKKLGNAGTALCGVILGFAAMAVRFITHDANLGIILSMGVLEAIGVQMATSMLMQCLMDSIDYGEWKNGTKPVAVLMSTYGIGSKIGLAFGSSVAGLIIGALNFDASLTVQPQSILNAFFNINIVLPMGMYIAMAAIFVYLRSVEKKLPQMRAEIEAGTNPGAANN